MANRNPAREQHWRGVLREWRGSGLTVYAFCKQRNLGPTNFRYWQQKLDLVVPSLSCPSTTFVPMTLVAESRVEIAVPGGVVLKVPLTASAEQIARWLTALQTVGASSC